MKITKFAALAIQLIYLQLLLVSATSKTIKIRLKCLGTVEDGGRKNYSDT